MSAYVSLDTDKLWTFWTKTNRVKPISEARKYFPSRPKGYVRVFKDLGNYASNMATYLRCYKKTYLDITKRIEADLPEYGKKVLDTLKATEFKRD